MIHSGRKWSRRTITDALRRTFWDPDSGSEYIADWEKDYWDCAEREWGDVIWRKGPLTPDLLRRLETSVDPISDLMSEESLPVPDRPIGHYE
jgi:hypothetical protein